MADTAIVLKHLQDAGLDPTPKLPYTALNAHKAADGLGLDRLPLAYLDSATNNLVATDNLPFLINAPGRYALIVSSAAIANTGTPTFFNKSATITGDALTALNTVGAVLRVTASGDITTRASSPGRVGFGIYPNAGALTFINTSAGDNAELAVNLTAQWHILSVSTVRTTGASATLALGGMIALPGIAPVLNSGNTETVDLTANVTIEVAWDWETADAANSATMTQLIIEIFRSGATVS
jgi:hypothetical protein